VGEQVLAGRHRPPWKVRRSLELRSLRVLEHAETTTGLARELAEWSGARPPPLPQ
jgi:hypothetical protein